MAMEHSPARSGIDVGSVIADTYTIEALIGRGGMGAVFMASHKRLPGKQVAIKVLHAELSGAEVLARFRREAEIASRLGHPNIVQVHDFNVMADGTPYLVLEFLRGESLAQRLANGPLPLDHALSIVRQVGSALAAAHREGIVHRDLKPQNIFLVPTEVDGRIVEIAKVLDFGISKIRGSQTVQTQDSALLGTPQYMAPEQATGQHSSLDERTDVFAFGAIVYEMLSGQPAFTGDSIPEVVFKVVYEQPTPLAERVPALPPAIVAAVERAMAKPAGERFASASDFVEALTGQPIAITRPGASIPPPDLGFAAGSRVPNTDREAFAQTMGSGDHGPAMAASAGLAATSAPGLAPTSAPGLAPTSAPGLAPTSAPGLAPTSAASAGSLVRDRAADVDAQQRARDAMAPAVPTSSRRTTLRFAALVATAAIAAGVMYVVMRDRAAPPQQSRVAGGVTPDAIVAAASADDAVAGDANRAAETATPDVAEAHEPTADTNKPTTDTNKPTADTNKPTADTKNPTANTRNPTADTKKSPPVADDDDDEAGGDEAAAKKLREAQAALTASDWDLAERLANSVMNSETAIPRQRARATMMYGMVQCLGRNDQGRAIAAARRLTGSPKLRRKLLDTCRRARR